MPAAGFEPTIPASERPQTREFDRAANGLGFNIISYKDKSVNTI
jgi:hypothetical protein